MNKSFTCLAFLLSPVFLFLHGQVLKPLTSKNHVYQIPSEVTPEDYIPGRMYVKIKDSYRSACTDTDIQIDYLNEVFEMIGVTKIDRLFRYSPVPERKFNEIGQEMVDVSLIYEIWFDPALYSVEDAVNLVLHSPAPEYAEPHYVYQLFYQPDDYDSSQYYLYEMQCFEAWDSTKGDSNVVIGIIDTGTSLTHPDLVNKHAYNLNDTLDGLDNDNDGYIDNYYGWDFEGNCLQCGPDNDPTWVGGAGCDHGVVVTGCAAADTDNGQCLAGAGFNTRIAALKTNVNFGNTIMRGYEAVVYAADHNMDILNLSWGGTVYTRFGEDAVNYAVINKGKVVVAAGGNTPADYRFYPACYHNVIGVSGTQQGGQIWFSSGSFGSTYNYLLDLAAASRNVGTTAQHAICDPYPSWATGTSLGSPLVCATIALARAKYPSLTNIQCGQVARITAKDTLYQINPSYLEKLGKGSVNALEAVRYNSPSVRISCVEFDDADDDGLVESGETLDVKVKFVNYLNPTGDLTITMTTPNGSDIQILSGSLNTGSLGTMDTASNYYVPFRIAITTSSSSLDKTVYLRFAYSDGSYTDWEYFPVLINERTLRFNKTILETSTNSTADIGIRQGLFFDSEVNYLAEGGFMIGTGSTKVSDNFRNNQTGTEDSDFAAVSLAVNLSPGTKADVQGYSEFNDNNAGGNKIGMTVEQHVYQNTIPEDSGYIIFEFILKNTSGSPVSGLYAGLFHDWDVGWWSNNYSIYDSTERLVWIYEPILTSWDFLASGLLTGDSIHAFSRDITGTYTTADKWKWLSSHPDSGNSPDTTDLFTTLSTGPLNFGTGAQDTIAFYFCGGKTLSELFDNAQRARDKYACVIRGTMPKVSLGSDIFHCGPANTYQFDAGAGYASYNWNTGDTAQAISVDSSALYIVRVTDMAGCEDHGQIQLTEAGVIAGGFTASSTAVLAGDTVWFSDTAANVQARAWDFGDGTAISIFSDPYHIYSAWGTYTVTLYQTDDCSCTNVCSDTTTMQIVVDTLVGIGTGEIRRKSQMSLYPNPANGILNLRVSSLPAGDATIRVAGIAGNSSVTLRQEHRGGEINIEINVAHLPSGIYIVEYGMDGYSGQGKFVKLFSP